MAGVRGQEAGGRRKCLCLVHRKQENEKTVLRAKIGFDTSEKEPVKISQILETLGKFFSKSKQHLANIWSTCYRAQVEAQNALTRAVDTDELKAEVHFTNEKTGEFLFYDLTLKAEPPGVLYNPGPAAPPGNGTCIWLLGP